MQSDFVVLKYILTFKRNFRFRFISAHDVEVRRVRLKLRVVSEIRTMKDIIKINLW